jgi:hypothetical protein
MRPNTLISENPNAKRYTSRGEDLGKTIGKGTVPVEDTKKDNGNQNPG